MTLYLEFDLIARNKTLILILEIDKIYYTLFFKST